MVTPQSSKINPLNPNNRSDEISHKSPATPQKIPDDTTFSYMETPTATATKNTGFIPKNVKNPGIV